MNFTKIEQAIWSDPDFESLPKDAKLLWFYLITNSRVNYAGIYKISKRRMALETGIDNIDDTLSIVIDTLPIHYFEDQNIVWIKNLLQK
ncbi:MAG: hypothetical protein ABEK36_04040, partial [Candidatus Aenigmatarchaeota archaeon]